MFWATLIGTCRLTSELNIQVNDRKAMESEISLHDRGTCTVNVFDTSCIFTILEPKV